MARYHLRAPELWDNSAVWLRRNSTRVLAVLFLLARHQQADCAGSLPCDSVDAALSVQEPAPPSARPQHQLIHTGKKTSGAVAVRRCFCHRLLWPFTDAHAHPGKPSPCPECGICFLHSSLLLSHRHIHSHERPFPCTECGKSSKRKHAQKAHHGIHQGYTEGPRCGSPEPASSLGDQDPQFMSTIGYIPGMWVTGVKCCEGVYDGRHCFLSSVHHSERVEAREKGKKGEVYKVTKSIGALESSFREQDIEVIGNVPASYVTQKWTGWNWTARIC